MLCSYFQEVNYQNHSIISFKSCIVKTNLAISEKQTINVSGQMGKCMFSGRSVRLLLK